MQQISWWAERDDADIPVRVREIEVGEIIRCKWYNDEILAEIDDAVVFAFFFGGEGGRRGSVLEVKLEMREKGLTRREEATTQGGMPCAEIWPCHCNLGSSVWTQQLLHRPDHVTASTSLEPTKLPPSRKLEACCSLLQPLVTVWLTLY